MADRPATISRPLSEAEEVGGHLKNLHCIVLNVFKDLFTKISLDVCLFDPF